MSYAHFQLRAQTLCLVARPASLPALSLLHLTHFLTPGLPWCGSQATYQRLTWAGDWGSISNKGLGDRCPLKLRQEPPSSGPATLCCARPSWATFTRIPALCRQLPSTAHLGGPLLLPRADVHLAPLPRHRDSGLCSVPRAVGGLGCDFSLGTPSAWHRTSTQKTSAEWVGKYIYMPLPAEQNPIPENKTSEWAPHPGRT